MLASLLAEMVPTWAISALLVGGRLGLSSSARDGGLHGLVDAALEVHRVHAGGDRLHALADDGLRQHGGGGGAVAGVVGGLEATSFTICAPMFSNLSASSISLATDAVLGDMSSSFTTRYSVPSSFTSVPLYLPNSTFVADLHLRRAQLAVVEHLAGADGDDFAPDRLLGGAVGMTIPPADSFSSSMRLMTTRSYSGLMFMDNPRKMLDWLGKDRF